MKQSAVEFSKDALPCTFEGRQPSTKDFAGRRDGNPLWKRVIDIIIALAALVFFAPLMVLGAVLARLDGGPSLFVNKRPGYGNRQIGVLKFRSMRVNAEQHLAALLSADPVAAEEFRRTAKLKNDPRITPVGRFLRASSLDELPQLINVLRGDMSIVGPRPRTYPEMDWATQYPQFDAYFKVRPGITGLWQVSGRSDTDYAKRVELDAEYVEGLSFYNDMKILAMTIPAILFSRGAV